MSYNALRYGRYSQRQQLYHIITVTRNRQPFFLDLAAGRIVVRELMALQAEERAVTLCFVLMPDHLHWLLELQQGTLAETMRRLKGRTARKLGRSLWQASFYDHAVRREENVQDLARYIVANPLRAGLVKKTGDYSLWDAIWL